MDEKIFKISNSGIVDGKFNPQGTLFALCDMNFNLIVVNVTDFTVVDVISNIGQVCCINFFMSDYKTLCGTKDGFLIIYDIEEKKYDLINENKQFNQITNICSCNKLNILCSLVTGNIIIYPNTDSEPNIISGHCELITSLCISPKENFFVTGCLAGIVRIWDTQSLQCIRSLNWSLYPVVSLAINSSGSLIIGMSSDLCVQKLTIDSLRAQLVSPGTGEAFNLMRVGFCEHNIPEGRFVVHPISFNKICITDTYGYKEKLIIVLSDLNKTISVLESHPTQNMIIVGTGPDDGRIHVIKYDIKVEENKVDNVFCAPLNDPGDALQPLKKKPGRKKKELQAVPNQPPSYFRGFPFAPL